jgi:hypothetical protein
MGYFGIRKSCHVIPGIYEWLHTGHMHPLYGREGEGPQGGRGDSGGHVALIDGFVRVPPIPLEVSILRLFGFIPYFQTHPDGHRWLQYLETLHFAKPSIYETGARPCSCWVVPTTFFTCVVSKNWRHGIPSLSTRKRSTRKGWSLRQLSFLFHVTRDFSFFFYMGLPNIMISQTPWIIGHPSAIFRAQVEWRDLVGPAEPDCHAVHCCSRGMRRGATARWPAA